MERIAESRKKLNNLVLKFQGDLYNQKFLIKTDSQAARFMFNKDCKHDVSKQMFARWKALLAPFDFEIQYKKEVFDLLENNDLKWRNDPWQIMARYFDTICYTTTVYKYRMHYKIILSSSGCEFRHFYPANTKKVYNFSKMIRKKILALEEWGMSTLKELDYIHPEQKIAVKYNYWDYIDGFNKVFLYENANKKHSSFIKICSNILPESFKKLYLEWVDISPKLISLREENIFFEGKSLMNFFIEFSIPWIMKWSVERTFYTKFWRKLLQKNPEGKLHGQEILDIINAKISKYYDIATTEPQVIEDLSPFKKITRKLQMKIGLISKSETIALYMEEIKKDLMRNLDIDIKDDIFMASASHTNEEDDNTRIHYEMLTIVKCILKFQDDLYNQKFIINTDAQSIKFMFNKDFKHDASKLMFAREVIILFQTSYQENTYKMNNAPNAFRDDSDIHVSLFLSEKRLITILKALHLNRDMKDLICWKIIHGMILDFFNDPIRVIEEIIMFEDMDDYYDAN
ncbi:hypothetical protein H5410_035850 [Solanum commersonii]|uniref:Reverse transcriptase RNase H-like domain-containing protein n=1 Tax=Solanum commersonii TaxID=4109 RepID=A0A9J5Y3S1_SOLCO|nr:hypothetical protein H5410_035850 [Solanum commersonii]